MAPTALLLVPTDGDPHGLLAEGPCGARPPMAFRVMDQCHTQVEHYPCDEEWGCPEDCDHQPVSRCDWCGEPWPCPEAGAVAKPGHWRSVSWPTGRAASFKGESLVLAWDGVVFPAGWHRAAEVAGGSVGHIYWSAMGVSGASVAFFEQAAEQLAADLGARLVRLDAEGQELELK